MHGIEIKLDKMRHLRYDMNAIADIERETGWDVTELIQRMKGRPGITLIRACVWAGLLHEDETLTIRQVGGWLTAKNMEGLWEKVIAGFNLAFGGDETPSPLADSAKPS